MQTVTWPSALSIVFVFCWIHMRTLNLHCVCVHIYFPFNPCVETKTGVTDDGISDDFSFDVLLLCPFQGNVAPVGDILNWENFNQILQSEKHNSTSQN